MKVFSYYLPQFHPDKMNNMFWGENFTDWETTKSANPLFRNHKQPFLPSDLGYYDLRDVDIIRKQASLARGYGIDGFAIYYYLFDEKTNSFVPNALFGEFVVVCFSNNAILDSSFLSMLVEY